jgi:hypothetical protein
MPEIVTRFPSIQQLTLAHCSALPEQAMLHMQSWPLTVLDVTNMWHWNGASNSACMAAWGGTLTQLIADGTALPLAAAADVGSAARDTSGRVGRSPQQQQQGSGQFSAAADAAPADTGVADVRPSSASNNTSLSAAQHSQHSILQTAAGAAQLGRQQNGSSSSSGGGGRDWVLCTGQLQQLQLRGILVDNPSRCRTHGSSDCSCQVSAGAK